MKILRILSICLLLVAPATFANTLPYQLIERDSAYQQKHDLHYCEVEVSNYSSYPARIDVAYDDQSFQSYHLAAKKALIFSLFYNGYCHDSAHFAVWSHDDYLLFNDYVFIGQSLKITNALAKSEPQQAVHFAVD